MLTYNSFWHFWSTVNNRYYARPFFISTVVSVILTWIAPLFVFSPPGLMFVGALFVASAVIAGAMLAMTRLSDFFYYRQQLNINTLINDIDGKLESIKERSSGKKQQLETLKIQLNWYKERRIICPDVLLRGECLELSRADEASHQTMAQMLSVEPARDLNLVKRSTANNRNMSFVDRNEKLFFKSIKTRDAMSEISARDMAELMGLTGIIPENSVCNVELGANGAALSSSSQLTRKVSVPTQVIADNMALNRIDGYQFKRRPHQLQPYVETFVERFISRHAPRALLHKAQNEGVPTLTYIQRLVPNIIDGGQWFDDVFPELKQTSFGHYYSGDAPRRTEQLALLQKLDQLSYEENVMLHLLLGSQDANPSNTLFKTDTSSGKVTIMSIDHERIMPEDNYNLTKHIPFGDGIGEQPCDNVFPMRIWLLGLPQADVPFSKETMQKVMRTWHSDTLAAYHQRKQYYVPSAVGAQIDRVQLIRQVFAAALEKPKITLTPKALFNMFISNHPSYAFLKKDIKLHDIMLYLTLGLTSSDAEWCIFTHPMQYFAVKKEIEASEARAAQKQPAFSHSDFTNQYARTALFYQQAVGNKKFQDIRQKSIDALDEVSIKLN